MPPIREGEVRGGGQALDESPIDERHLGRRSRERGGENVGSESSLGVEMNEIKNSSQVNLNESNLDDRTS